MSHWLLGQLWTQELSVNVLASTINNIPEPTTTLLQTTDNRNIQRHFLGSECSDAKKLLLSVCEQKLTFTIQLGAARCKYGVRCNEERGISSQELIAACTAILISWIKICYFALSVHAPLSPTPAKYCRNFGVTTQHHSSLSVPRLSHGIWYLVTLCSHAIDTTNPIDPPGVLQ